MADELLPDSSDDLDLEKGQGLVSLGAESLSALAGASVGLVFGPPGALAGAAAGPALARILRFVGGNIRGRLLSHREEERIGGAFVVAVARIEQRREAGETPRQDGFYEPGEDPEGLLEGALLSAARSYHQKKVPFMGAFYASFVFEANVSSETAHYLLHLLDRLTYRQLAALAYLNDPERQSERERIRTTATEEGDRTSPTLSAELNDLANLGMIGFEQEGGWVANPLATLGGGQVSARSLVQTVPTELGRTLARMAELRRIPAADQDQIASALKGDVT